MEIRRSRVSFIFSTGIVFYSVDESLHPCLGQERFADPSLVKLSTLDVISVNFLCWTMLKFVPISYQSSVASVHEHGVAAEAISHILDLLQSHFLPRVD